MAELDTSTGGHKKKRGVKKTKKLSTRVDLTPMVDLGFLLITFFIFTTSMTRPTIMKLNLPDDTDPAHPSPVKLTAVITLLPGGNDLVWYYERNDPTTMKWVPFAGVRSIILDKKRRTDPKYFQVILKPSKDATYKNAVDILNEMIIDGVHHYAMVDIDPVEYKMMQNAPPKI
jgi:biopolymer transport protein ExbD